MKALLVLSTALFLGLSAQAYENRCHDYREGSVKSLCDGRVIPASKARNFHANSQKLLCTSNADHFIRSPQKYDFAKWNDLVKMDQNQEAQNMRKQQPNINWSGKVPYQTVEVWSWESCDLVTDGFACGTHVETRTVTRYKQECSGSGEKRKCVDIPYQAEEKVDVPNTCWSDVTRSESAVCSNEVLTYNAAFARPNYSQWNPKNPAYMDALPNKYDLLPGEIEDVQIFSNNSSSDVVNPVGEVGDAWNKYQFAISGSGAGARCRQNDNLHVDVVVNTVERLQNKKTPNAFKLPRDMKGNPIDPIVWQAAQDKDGKMIQKGVPMKLRLADTSSGIINSISEQSKKTADREEMKQQKGEGVIKDAMSPEEQARSGFFKNTKVRVQFVKKNETLWDTSTTKRIILDQGESIVPTVNVLSEDQEIAYSDMWEVALRKDNDNGAFASRWLSRDRHLKPGQAYYFEVSMYQKGARGLYLQDCDEAPSFWSCSFRWLGLGKTEGRLYSNPLKIDFATDANMKDERGMFDKFMDWVK